MQNVDQTSIYISVFTLGEMRTGIDLFSDAKRMSGKTARFNADRKNATVIDSLIAATAQHHDLTIVMRNISDFESTGLRVINPFS